MTIENIIKKIQSETSAEVSKIINDAQQKAKELVAEANKSFTEKQAQLEAQGNKKITIVHNIHLSEARRTARRTEASAKEEIINKCFLEASEKLRALTGAEYKKVMDRLISESMELIGDKGVVTLTREEDKGILSSYPNLKIKDSIMPGLGGIIIESANGKIVVDNTFNAILERKKEDIRTEVANILYPEAEN